MYCTYCTLDTRCAKKLFPIKADAQDIQVSNVTGLNVKYCDVCDNLIRRPSVEGRIVRTRALGECRAYENSLQN